MNGIRDTAKRGDTEIQKELRSSQFCAKLIVQEKSGRLCHFVRKDGFEIGIFTGKNDPGYRKTGKI